MLSIYRSSLMRKSIVSMLVALVALMPGAYAWAAGSIATDDLTYNHVNPVSQVDFGGIMELGRLLAVDEANLGYFEADYPGSNAYDGGWAIIDLNSLNGGAATATKSFQAQNVYYRAGGISDSGLFVAMRYDARPSADKNRNDVVVYDVSDPSAPEIYGRYRMDKPAGVAENKIDDLVVYGNRAYLSVTVFSTNPGLAFDGIVVLDLTSPDPVTKALPELSRAAYPSTELDTAGNGKMYAYKDGLIYGFDLSAGLSFLGSYDVGLGFVLDVGYGENGVIGRKLGKPTYLDFSSSFSDPVVTTIQGEPFTAYDQIDDVLLASGRGHARVVIRLEAADTELFGVTVGWVDQASVQEASALAAAESVGGPFLFTVGSAVLYRLQHDGWRPGVQLTTADPAVVLNGEPLAPGTSTAVESGDEVGCLQGEGSSCTSAVEAVCNDEEAFELIRDAAVMSSQSSCPYLVKTGEFDNLDSCQTLTLIFTLKAYFTAMALLCRDVWSDGGTPSLSIYPATVLSEPDIRIELEEGGFQMTGSAANLTYALESSLASGKVEGGGTIQAAHFISKSITVFEAIDAPVTVTPANPSLAPFTLQRGQIVGVTADQVLPVEETSHSALVPFVVR